jgi:hypothetical protein
VPGMWHLWAEMSLTNACFQAIACLHVPVCGLLEQQHIANVAGNHEDEDKRSH